MSIRAHTFATTTHDIKMKTYILQWTPEDSPYKEEDFLDDICALEFGDFSWAFPDPTPARSGDNFYMVKGGDGPSGIVMKGFFTSDPYPDGGSFLMRMRPTFMVSPRHPLGLLSDFPWSGAPSGMELPWPCSLELARMWEEYESRFGESDLDGVMADRSRRPEAGIDEAVSLASDALFDRREPDGSPAILRSLSAGLSGRSTREKICGFLQGVLGTKEWTAGEIREKGFPEEVIDELVACYA